MAAISNSSSSVSLNSISFTEASASFPVDEVFDELEESLTAEDPAAWNVSKGKIQSGEIDLTSLDEESFFHILAIASKRGNLDALRTFLEPFPERVNGEFGFSPLYSAIKANRLECTRFLLAHQNIDPYLSCPFRSETLVEYALSKGSKETIDLFLERRLIALPPEQFFHSLIVQSNTERLSLLLDYFPELITAQNRLGQSLLHMAAERGEEYVCVLCIDRGMQVAETDLSRKSAVDRAIEGGYRRVAEKLALISRLQLGQG